MFDPRFKIVQYHKISNDSKDSVTFNIFAKIQPREWYIDFLLITTYFKELLT